MIGGIEGAEERMAEWRNKGDEGRGGFLLARSVSGMKEKVLVRMDRVAMGNVLKWWERRKCLIFGTEAYVFGIPTLPFPPTHLPKFPGSSLIQQFITMQSLTYLFKWN